MRNPYAFGFWCLAVALVLLTTAMLASAAISAAEMRDIIAAVAAWSTAAQAITSLALVIFAMLGFTMWKRQVRYEKGMNVIWTAMAALHRVDVSFQRVATELLVSGTPVDFEVLIQVGFQRDALRLEFEQFDQGIAQGVENIVTVLHGSVSGSLFGGDESRKAGHVGKVITGVFGVGIYLDAVGFLNRQAQL